MFYGKFEFEKGIITTARNIANLQSKAYHGIESYEQAIQVRTMMADGLLSHFGFDSIGNEIQPDSDDVEFWEVLSTRKGVNLSLETRLISPLFDKTVAFFSSLSCGVNTKFQLLQIYNNLCINSPEDTYIANAIQIHNHNLELLIGLVKARELTEDDFIKLLVLSGHYFDNNEAQQVLERGSGALLVLSERDTGLFEKPIKKVQNHEQTIVEKPKDEDHKYTQDELALDEKLKEARDIRIKYNSKQFKNNLEEMYFFGRLNLSIKLALIFRFLEVKSKGLNSKGEKAAIQKDLAKMYNKYNFDSGFLDLVSIYSDMFEKIFLELDFANINDVLNLFYEISQSPKVDDSQVRHRTGVEELLNLVKEGTLSVKEASNLLQLTGFYSVDEVIKLLEDKGFRQEVDSVNKKRIDYRKIEKIEEKKVYGPVFTTALCLLRNCLLKQNQQKVDLAEDPLVSRLISEEVSLSENILKELVKYLRETNWLEVEKDGFHEDIRLMAQGLNFLLNNIKINTPVKDTDLSVAAFQSAPIKTESRIVKVLKRITNVLPSKTESPFQERGVVIEQIGVRERNQLADALLDILERRNLKVAMANIQKLIYSGVVNWDELNAISYFIGLDLIPPKDYYTK